MKIYLMQNFKQCSFGKSLSLKPSFLCKRDKVQLANVRGNNIKNKKTVVYVGVACKNKILFGPDIEQIIKQNLFSLSQHFPPNLRALKMIINP